MPKRSRNARLLRSLCGVLVLVVVVPAAAAASPSKLRPASAEVRLNAGDRPAGRDSAGFWQLLVTEPHKIVAVWNAPTVITDLDNEDVSIFGRWFDDNLVALTPEFLVDTLQHIVDTGDTWPATAVTSDGDVIVSWTLQGGSYKDIANVIARRFRYPMTLVGDEFVVNTTLKDDQRMPRVLATDPGKWTIVWKDIQDESIGFVETVRFQHYRDGSPFGAEQVIRNCDQTILGSGIASRDGVSYLAWRGLNAADPVGQVFVARVESDGTLGEPVTVSDAGIDARLPEVAELSNGNILVVWRQGVVGSTPAGLFTRVLDSELLPVTRVQRIWKDDFPNQRRFMSSRVAASDCRSR